MARRRTRGSSLLEVVISVGVGLTIVAGAGAIAKSSGDLAASSGMVDGASRRVQRILDTAQDEIRRASAGSFRRADGSAFADGATDRGVSFRRVTGYRGTPQLDTAATLRWVVASGATEGEVVLSQGGIEEVISRDVIAFSVRRSGNSMIVTTSVRLGTGDDRGRISRGSITVLARND